MKITRRRFLSIGALVGGGILVGYSATRPSRHRRVNDELAENGEHFVTSSLKIEPNNEITVYVPHAEMGQGVHTSLSMMAADEMDADWQRVKVKQAPATDLFANSTIVKGFASEVGLPGFLQGLVSVSAVTIAEIMNIQTTGGSTSVRYTGETAMRTAGAAAREMLIACAAIRWSVSADECTTQLSHVHHKASGRLFSYGELASEAALLEPPESPVMKKPSQYTLMGKPVARVDIPAKVNGSAQYGIDAHSEEMLYAALRLAPVFGSKLVSVDVGEALERRGVKRVVELEDSVAVVADSYWRAKEALKLVKAEFETSAYDSTSSADIFAQFDQNLAGEESSEEFEQGDTHAALASAAEIVEASYRVPFLAHATMEPMNCTVHIRDGKADLWTSTQDALGIKGRVASIAGLSEEDVVFHHCYVGGGFGRRLPFNWNVIDHATLIAQQFDVPVKTILSREDDMQQDYYRPAVASTFKAAIDEKGNVNAWRNRFTGPVQGAGAAHIPYAIPHQSIHSVEGETHVPIGAWRSVDHSQQTFFIESFIDELAHGLGKDPYQFRMELLSSHPRHRNVLKIAADAAGYQGKVAEGRALGIAIQESFGSIVAEVAEVSLDQNNRPVVDKVTCAIDCGFAVHPDTVEAQVESGIIFGLSAALYGEITIKNGRVEQENFPNYEMVRLAATPEIDVRIVESGESIGGMGEPSTPPIAPAVTNAIYQLTGQRVRTLPIKNHDFSS